jgi:group I intron endonuclease
MKCVYKILNLKNGKYYIGSTKQYNIRVKQHINKLNKNKHTNIKLQRAWNKYNSENFEFIILEKCDNYKEREDYYLSLVDVYNNTYNICEDSKCTWYLEKHPNKEKIKKSIIESRNNYLRALSKEDKEKIYGRKGKNHHNYKGGIISNCIDCNEEIYYKSERCRKCYIKNDSGNQKGVTQSKETIEKRSDKMKQLYKQGYNPVGKIVEIERIIYKSVLQASKQLEIPYTTLTRRLKSTKFPDYKIINKCATTSS